MAEANVYQQLAKRVGAGNSKYIPGIFESLANEKEATVLLAAASPAAIQDLAEQTGIEKSEIEKMIDPLFKKGLLFKSKKGDETRYYCVRNLIQMHDATAVMLDPPEKMLDLWKQFMALEFNDFNRKLEQVLPEPLIRVIPVNISVEPKTHILAFDDVKNLVNEARNIAVTRCSCRVIDGSCGKPLEVCLQFNKAADYALERGTGRPLSKEEAVDILKMCEEEGLIHVGANKSSVGHVICNCCSDCCLNWPSVRTGLGKFVVPSRFQAVVDPELCSACETCLERCYFEAISIQDEKAEVNGDKCMGCGLCLVTCPENAINLEEVRPEDFIPADRLA